MRAVPAAALMIILTAVAGCAGGTTGGADGAGRETLTVLAAASLTESFTELGDAFEEQHPAVDVRLAFDSSATLAGQVVEGAPADVLATADVRTMRTVTEAGATAGEPRLFAQNSMVLVVPAGNPAGIERFADLEGSTYLACVTSAPCGALARTLLEANQVATPPKSLEVDVKAVLNKVVLDEADAGLVYASDATAAGDRVQVLEIPKSSGAVNSYLVAPLRESEHARLARDWVDLLLSDRGRAVLRHDGFGTP
ncbi:MAG TPA: molybdate ABC transporter substrate-binding protein [Nocardioidaceae bacterium]|nr:molybdate ABC transporter substrate-binding protein [Nocardioidaceae bacterium]